MIATGTTKQRRKLAAVMAAAFVAGGCQMEIGGDQLAPDENAFDDGETPTSPDGRTVPLEVGRAAVGGGTLIFVPVHFDGEGPYTFVLDTGASNTAIDSGLAEELGLANGELEGRVEGITGEGSGTALNVESWRLGDVELDSHRLIAIDLDSQGGGFGEFDGLLGSDLLSEFGSVTVDYDAGVLILPE